MLTNATVAMVMTVALTGCGNGFSAPQARGGFGAMASAVVDDADIPLDRDPVETITVPSAPSRAAQPATRGNGAKLFVSPSETEPAVEALIKNAKKSVYLETFNFGWESYGEKIVPLLIERAKAGLEVKVNMDYIGSRFLKGHKDMVKKLRAGGVDVRIYRCRTIIKDDHKIGFNITHRKVYLVDGQRALIGGVNLCKDFDTTTQDVLIEWKGPVVAQLYQEFTHDWQQAGGGALMQSAEPTGNQGSVEAQIILTSPGEGRFDAKETIYRELEGAKREILIEQQYLFDDGVIKRLHAALKRGVKVRTMVPGKEAKGIFKNIHAAEMARLVAEGAECREYHGNPASAHLHAKYVNVDDRWAMCGSINLDTRALIENQELAVAFRDPALNASMRQRLFERDWAQFSDPFVYEPNSWVVKRVSSLLELIDYYL
jgi:cardiolipin synthase